MSAAPREPADHPDLDELLRSCADLLDKATARTGKPRRVYEEYLTRVPDPGVAWSTALHVRLASLVAGPLPAHVKTQISRMVPARTTGRQADAA